MCLKFVYVTEYEFYIQKEQNNLWEWIKNVQFTDEATESHRGDVICSESMFQNRAASFQGWSQVLIELWLPWSVIE